MAGELFKIKFGIRYRGWPRGWRKAFLETNKEELSKLGVYWHRRIFPQRFTQSGARELTMQMRAPGYQLRKREEGENVPLVGPRSSSTSGGLRRTSMGQARVTVTSRRMTVRITVPDYVLKNSGQATKKGSRKPDMRDELKRVSPRHLDQMARLHDRNMTMQLNRLRSNENVTIE